MSIGTVVTAMRGWQSETDKALSFDASGGVQPQLFRSGCGIKQQEVGEVVQREARLRVLGPRALGHGLAEGRRLEDSPLPATEEQARAWEHGYLLLREGRRGNRVGTQEEGGEVRDGFHQGRVGKFRDAKGPRRQRHLDQRGCALGQ